MKTFQKSVTPWLMKSREMKSDLRVAVAALLLAALCDAYDIRVRHAVNLLQRILEQSAVWIHFHRSGECIVNPMSPVRISPTGNQNLIQIWLNRLHSRLP